MDDSARGPAGEDWQNHRGFHAKNQTGAERQKERLKQLIKDGYIPRIAPHWWERLTHEQATEQITRGKLTEQRVLARRQAA